MNKLQKTTETLVNREPQTELIKQQQDNTLIENQQWKKMLRLSVSRSQRTYRPYGNMIVLLKQPIFITIGPHYYFFLPIWLLILASSIGVSIFVFETTLNWIFRISTIMVCSSQVVVYGILGLSNPGIQQEQSLQNHTRYCIKCNLYVTINSVYCIYCDVCIRKFDHHCPWTSKCIGKDNLLLFYIFIGLTPIFITYCALSSAFCLMLSVRI